MRITRAISTYVAQPFTDLANKTPMYDPRHLPQFSPAHARVRLSSFDVRSLPIRCDGKRRIAAVYIWDLVFVLT